MFIKKIYIVLFVVVFLPFQIISKTKKTIIFSIKNVEKNSQVETQFEVVMSWKSCNRLAKIIVSILNERDGVQSLVRCLRFCNRRKIKIKNLPTESFALHKLPIPLKRRLSTIAKVGKKIDVEIAAGYIKKAIIKFLIKNNNNCMVCQEPFLQKVPKAILMPCCLMPCCDVCLKQWVIHSLIRQFKDHVETFCLTHENNICQMLSRLINSQEIQIKCLCQKYMPEDIIIIDKSFANFYKIKNWSLELLNWLQPSNMTKEDMILLKDGIADFKKEVLQQIRESYLREIYRVIGL